MHINLHTTEAYGKTVHIIWTVSWIVSVAESTWLPKWVIYHRCNIPDSQHLSLCLQSQQMDSFHWCRDTTWTVTLAAGFEQRLKSCWSNILLVNNSATDVHHQHASHRTWEPALWCSVLVYFVPTSSILFLFLWYHLKSCHINIANMFQHHLIPVQASHADQIIVK